MFDFKICDYLINNLPFGIAIYSASRDVNGEVSSYSFNSANRIFLNVFGSNDGRLDIDDIASIVANYETDMPVEDTSVNGIINHFVKREESSFDFYSHITGEWYKLKADGIDEDSIIFTLKDITEEKAKHDDLKTLFLSMNDIVFEMDTDFVFRKVWTVSEDKLFMPKKDIIGKTIYDIYDKEYLGIFVPALQKALDGEEKGERSIIEYRSSKFENAWFRAESYVSVDNFANKKIICVIKDISDIKRAEMLKIQEENKFKALVQSMEEGVALHELVYDSDGEAVNYRIIETNDSFYRHLGIKGRIKNGVLATEAYGVDEPPFLEIYRSVALTGDPVKFDTHYEPTGKHFRISAYSPQRGYFATVFTDVTEDIRKEREITYLSYHDALTGLYNRAFFEEEAMRLSNNRYDPVSVIIGDVNGLKVTNDVFGHLAGDRLLKSIANVIKKACRAGDIVARWGGDEFVILLPLTEAKQANEICERIAKACEEDTEGPIKLSISLGVASRTELRQDINEILKDAEDQMYRRKLVEGKSFRNSLLKALIVALEKKSDESKSHYSEISHLSEMYCSRIGLSQPQISDIKLLSAIHDIGKISIDERIFTKSEPLTEDEWEEIRKHPEVGYRLAQTTPEFAHVADLILYHHERWDGKGYPRGLSGGEIPLLARIIAVIDAYVVMTSGRAYRRALTKGEALIELEQNSGSQFDTTVVKEFIKMMNEAAT